jgi:hypothetical protein
MTTRCPFGFRIVGSVAGERRFIDWTAAFSAYAACDARAEVEKEAYLSAFTFGEAFKLQLDTHRSTKGFTGPCCSPWLWFDIDREGDLDTARRDAVRLAHFLTERFQLDDDALLLFFSGAKGFHIGIPSALWQPEPSGTYHRSCRRLAECLADLSQVRIDTAIYDAVRAFRAPNSRHPKTGLHKRRFTLEELTGLSLERLLAMAKEPAPFDLPEPPSLHPQADADWRTALDALEHKTVSHAERASQLQRETLEFIRDGADNGERHVRLFRAAANLSEWGCPLPLAQALLEEAALDSGLPPAEVRRQIDCGWSHANGKQAAPTRSEAMSENVSLSQNIRAKLQALWKPAASPLPEADETAAERNAIQWEGCQHCTPEKSQAPEPGSLYPPAQPDMPFPPH